MAYDELSVVFKTNFGYVISATIDDPFFAIVKQKYRTLQRMQYRCLAVRTKVI